MEGGYDLVRIFRLISDGIQKVCNVLAASILGIMTIVFFLNIIQRYIFGQGYHGNEEITRYGMIWMVFICGVILTKSDEHLNVSILEGMFKVKGNETAYKVIKLVQRVIMLVFFLIMAYISFTFVKVGARQTSPNIGISMSLVYLIFPISFILMAFQVLFVIVDDLLKKPATQAAERAPEPSAAELPGEADATQDKPEGGK